MFYGGSGGGIDIGSGPNVEYIAVVAVVIRSILSHLQRFIPLIPHRHVRRLSPLKAHINGAREKNGVDSENAANSP